MSKPLQTPDSRPKTAKVKVGGAGKVIDLTGRRFGMLLVLERASNTPQGKARWLCLCDCGRRKVIRSWSLINGENRSKSRRKVSSGCSRSCGCVHGANLVRYREKRARDNAKGRKNYHLRKQRQLTENSSQLDGESEKSRQLTEDSLQREKESSQQDIFAAVGCQLSAVASSDRISGSTEHGFVSPTTEPGTTSAANAE